MCQGLLRANPFRNENLFASKCEQFKQEVYKYTNSHQKFTKGDLQGTNPESDRCFKDNYRNPRSEVSLNQFELSLKGQTSASETYFINLSQLMLQVLTFTLYIDWGHLVQNVYTPSNYLNSLHWITSSQLKITWHVMVYLKLPALFEIYGITIKCFDFVESAHIKQMILLNASYGLYLTCQET